MDVSLYITNPFSEAIDKVTKSIFIEMDTKRKNPSSTSQIPKHHYYPSHQKYIVEIQYFQTLTSCGYFFCLKFVSFALFYFKKGQMEINVLGCWMLPHIIAEWMFSLLYFVVLMYQQINGYLIAFPKERKMTFSCQMVQ